MKKIIVLCLLVILLLILFIGCKQNDIAKNTIDKSTDKPIEKNIDRDESDNQVQSMQNANELHEGIIITAKIEEINENGYLVDCIDNNELSLTKVYIRYVEGVIKPYYMGNIGDIIMVKLADEIMESFPVQAKILEVISIEPDMIIQIDNREMISGIIGTFPYVIGHENNTEFDVIPDKPFVIVMHENSSAGYTWMIDNKTDDMEVFKDIYVQEKNNHYFGMKLPAGIYEIILSYQKIGNDPIKTIVFNINSTDAE